MGGDIWVSTLHSQSANPLANVHAAWTNFVIGFCGSTMNAMWNTHQSATEVVTDQLDPFTGKNVAQNRTTISQVGTGTGGSPSPRNCLVVGLITALPARRGRGRMYWPSPDDSHYTTLGKFVSADCTTISAGFASNMTTFLAVAQPVVFHRATLTSDNVIDVKVGDIVGTQRRRTNKDTQTYAVSPI